MPSTYAHYRFGQEVLELLPEKIKKIIASNIDLYNMGLHGPDLLFYYKPLSSNRINATGYETHEKTGRGFMEQAGQVILSHPESCSYLIYIYGFICHFALDRACHGYIEERINSSGISHAEIEVELDRALMVIDGYNPIKKGLTNHIKPEKKPVQYGNSDIIAAFYPGITKEEVHKAVKSMVFYLNLLVSPSSVKRAIVYSILKMSGNYEIMKGLIVNREPNPKCEESNQRLMEFYEEAKIQAVDMITQYVDNIQKKKDWCGLYQYTFEGIREEE